jgi:hypothetical protein
MIQHLYVSIAVIRPKELVAVMFVALVDQLLVVAKK